MKEAHGLFFLIETRQGNPVTPHEDVCDGVFAPRPVGKNHGVVVGGAADGSCSATMEMMVRRRNTSVIWLNWSSIGLGQSLNEISN